jgi:hypothetical protein
LFLLCAAQGFSQELLDSVSFAEMEDSISGMSIVPVKKPKELLDSIIEQVILDSQQKPIRCKYQVMQTSGLHTSRPTTSSCIFYAVANIRIKSTGRGEKFRFDGPRPLRNLNDTTYAYYDLRDMMEGQYILWIVQTNAASEGVSVFQSFQKLMRMHYIKVYSISDEKGRGVYRVDFSPRKHIGYGFCARKYNGTAYFDRNFHIKQIETDKIVPSSYDITGRQDKDGLLSHITCQHYRMDFDEVDGTTVVKKIESSSSVDNQIMGKYTVQRLP